VVPNKSAFSEVTIAVLVGTLPASLSIALTPKLSDADQTRAIVALAGFMAALSTAVATVPHLVLYFARDAPTYEALAAQPRARRDPPFSPSRRQPSGTVALLITASSADRSSPSSGTHAANTAGCVAGSLAMGFA
jgi:hypothetical protein